MEAINTYHLQQSRMEKFKKSNINLRNNKASILAWRLFLKIICYKTLITNNKMHSYQKINKLNKQQIQCTYWVNYIEP